MTEIPGWMWSVVLLAPVFTAICLLWIYQFRRAQGLQSSLRSARREYRALSEVLDVWQWRSNSLHRLTHLSPPRDANSLTWSEVQTDGLVWDRFTGTEASALRARIEARTDLIDIPVSHVHGSKPLGQGVVRGVALLDDDGSFSGYVGTFRPTPGSAKQVQPPALIERDEQASFSYTVSHDLRAPIRVVEGFAKILKEDYGRLLDRVGNDHIDRIVGAAARMNRMIDSLLALAQLSHVALANEPVNLSQLGHYVVDDLRKQSPDREVQVQIEPGMITQGDPTLLRMALENLLGNAWKYSSKTPAASIVFERSIESPNTFTIRDNGAGFDMRFADRLFGAFQRLHGSHDFQGTGVGLASVRKIIQRHGGEIWAQGAVNQGAQFHFSLPQGALGTPEPMHPR
jgi:signal transduction histidine kinase